MRRPCVECGAFLLCVGRHYYFEVTAQALDIEDAGVTICGANRAMQVHRLKMAEAPEGQAPRTQPVIRTSREAIEIPE
jgi:hypothetical protein